MWGEVPRQACASTLASLCRRLSGIYNNPHYSPHYKQHSLGTVGDMLSNVGCKTAALMDVTAKEMVMRFSNRGAIALLIAGLSAGAWQVAASPAPKNDPTVEPAGPIVHEWGTFSTFSGSDGANLR